MIETSLTFVKYSNQECQYSRPPGEFLPVGSLQGKLREKPHFFESLPRLKRNKVKFKMFNWWNHNNALVQVNVLDLWVQFRELLWAVGWSKAKLFWLYPGGEGLQGDGESCSETEHQVQLRIPSPVIIHPKLDQKAFWENSSQWEKNGETKLLQLFPPWISSQFDKMWRNQYGEEKTPQASDSWISSQFPRLPPKLLKLPK